MGSGASATKNAVVAITRLRQKRKAVVDSNGEKKSRTSSEQGPVSPALAIFEAAADLGLDPCREMELLWLAEHMTQNLPDGWTRHQDATHGSFFSHKATGESRWEHPRQHVYKEVIGLHRRALRERSFKGANEDAEKAGEEAWSEAEVAWRVVRQRRKKARWRKVMDSVRGKSLPGSTEDIRKVALEEHRLRLKLLEKVRGMHLEFEAAHATRSQKKLSHIPGLHGEASLATAFGAGGIWADRERCVELGVDVDQGDETAELTGFSGLVRRTKSRVAAVTQKFSRMWLNGGPSEEDARSEEDSYMDVAKVARLAALMRKSMARTLRVPQMELRLQEAVNLGLRRYHAASIIQGMVRGRLQRNRFRLVIEHYRIRVHCAKVIQSHVRQWSRRRREKMRTLRTNSKGRRGSLFQSSTTVGHLSASLPVGKLSRGRSSSNASVQSLPAVGKTTSLHMSRPSVWALPEVFNNVTLPARRPSAVSSTPADSCLKARRHSVSSQTESYSLLSSPDGSPSSSQKRAHFSAQAEIPDSELPRDPELPTGSSPKPALKQMKPETASFMLPESDQGDPTASETLRLQEVSGAEERKPQEDGQAAGTLAEEQKAAEPQAAQQEGREAVRETVTVQAVEARIEEQPAAEQDPSDIAETTTAHCDQITATSESLAEAQVPGEGGVVYAGEPGQEKQGDASTGAEAQKMEERPLQEADVHAQQQGPAAEDGEDGEVSTPLDQEAVTGGAKDADVATPHEQEEEQQEASTAGTEGVELPGPQELPTASPELAEVSAVEVPTAGAEGAETPAPPATALAEGAELPAPRCAEASAPQEPSTAGTEGVELPGPQEFPTAGAEAEAPAPPVEGEAEKQVVLDGRVREPQAEATPQGEEELEETPVQGAAGSAGEEEGSEQAGAQEQRHERVQQTEPQDAEEAAQASGLPTGPREVEAAAEDRALGPAREDAEAMPDDRQKVDVTDSGLGDEGPASVDLTVLEAEPGAQGAGAQEETTTQAIADEGGLGSLPSQPGPSGAGEGPEAAEPVREVGHRSPAAWQEEGVQTMEPVSSEGALVPTTKGTEEPERLLKQDPVSKAPERPVTVTTKEVGVQAARDEASSSEAPARSHSRGDRGRVGDAIRKREDCRQLSEARKGRRAPSQPNKAPLLAPPLPKAKPQAFSSASESHEDGAAEVSQTHPQELADYAVGAAVRAARALSSSSISSMKDTYAELSSAPASDTQAPKPADFALRAADFYEIMRAQRQRKGEEGSAHVRSQSAGAGYRRARDEGADPSSALVAQSRAARFFEENRRTLQSLQPGGALQQEKTRPSPRDQCPVPAHTVTQRPSTAGHQKRSGTKPQRSASAGYLRQPAAAAPQDPASTCQGPARLLNQGPLGAARVFQHSCSTSSGHVCSSQELLPLIDATIDSALEMGLRRSRGRRSGARRGVNRVATLPAATFEHLSFGDELTLKPPLPASFGGLF